MTFCLGVKVAKGLVAISDSRITSGSEVSSKKKMYTHTNQHGTVFIMTSGLRSVRDKSMTYFQEIIESNNEFDKLYKVVNCFGDQVKKVAKEDKAFLLAAGLHFNLSAIIGGKFSKDDEHKLYMVYPEGNWIEITPGSPFIIIGNSGYGKPILYRNINYNTPINEVLKLGFLAFDSTRVSANDVDFPIDVLVFDADSNKTTEKVFQKSDLEHISYQWNDLLNESVKKLSDDWISPFLNK